MGVVLLWLVMVLFTTESLNLHDPPDGMTITVVPRGRCTRGFVICVVKGVYRLPILGRMTQYVLTHTRAHTITHALTHTTTRSIHTHAWVSVMCWAYIVVVCTADTS